MDYTRIYNLNIKDSLPTGNSGKVIKGAELDAEYNAIVSAIASKSDINSPTFTGTPAAPTAIYGTNTTQLATTAFVQAALQALYPVGSVYINASSTSNPSSLLGFGTWVSVGDGKVLVNQDTADTSFDTLGETGGSKNAIVVEHNHSATSTSSSTSTSAVTDPGHIHSVPSTGAYGGLTSGPFKYAGTQVDSTINTNSSVTGITVATSTSTTTSTTVANSGSSGTNANLQPYVVVKMWKRTA